MEIKTINLDKANQTMVNTNSSSSALETKPKSKLIPVLMFIAISLAGFYSGAFLKESFSGKSSLNSGDLKNIQSEVPQTGVKVGDIYGSPDEKAFNTTATGVLDKGGLNGEGTHKLVRPGGVSQTVYLTSSVIDLDTLVGSQVTIWGQTFKGQKAGWLMDVGRAKVENLNAPLPK